MELMKEPFKKPTPLEMIAAELSDAHLEKLNAETAVEYAQSIVDYNMTRITRLNSRLGEYRNDVDTTKVGGTK
jgi:ribosome assembly protein YihI (activator of Der GTPase)